MSPIVTPSGQSVELVEALAEGKGDEAVLRLRFLAPALSGAAPVDPDAALNDIAWLCQSYAMPNLPTLFPDARQIVVSMMDRNVPFGETDDQAVQYFDAFTISDGTCELELFYD